MAGKSSKQSEAKTETAPGRGGGKMRLVLKLAAFVIPAAFFIYIFSICMNFSLNDPDLWWHLKTGEYIVTHWEVPEEDPFAYTTPRPLDEEKRIGLKGQWLGQVIFYLSYSLGGLLGIGIMRNLFVITPMVVLYIWLLRRGLKWWLSFLIVILPSLFLSVELFYSFERPQGISFTIIMLACMLLERLRVKSTGDKFDFSFWLLPLTMALWSNIHAGYIVGNVIIMLYMGSELAMAFYRKAFKKSWQINRTFLVVCLVAVCATFLNPNVHKLFFPYFKGLLTMFFRSVSEMASPERQGWVESVVLEYKPLYYFYKELGYKWLMFYWLFSALLWVAMFIKFWLKRKIDLAELAVVAIITFFANYYARGLMFSLTVLPFYFGKTIAETGFKDLKSRFFSIAATATLAVVLISFSTYTYRESPYMFKPGMTREWITPWYPTRLVEFLKEIKIPGPMYNFYTWGGFLIWSLYPEYRVFIDGRALDDLINRTADSILKTYPGWENQLNAYNINFIIIPAVFRESGHVIPLAPALAEHPEWKLVFIRNNSAIFVKDVPQNRKYIQYYNVDKKAIYREIINVENIFLSGSPYNPIHHIAKADALLALEHYDEARAIYERFPREGIHGLERLKAMGK